MSAHVNASGCSNTTLALKLAVTHGYAKWSTTEKAEVTLNVWARKL
jgi:hypothetical protein